MRIKVAFDIICNKCEMVMCIKNILMYIKYKCEKAIKLVLGDT